MSKLAHIAVSWLLAFPMLGQTVRVVWDMKEPYADRILYNGQRYKSIQATDNISVLASMNHTIDLTVAIVAILNTGKVKFDVDPELFTCTCLAPKIKPLKHHWPFKMDRNPSVAVLRANTVAPGDEIKGMVSFEPIRKCSDIKLVIPIHNVSFEFPFTHTGSSSSGAMN